MPKSRNEKNTPAIKKRQSVKSVGWEGHVVILFTDIVGCSKISSHETLENYNKILQQFKTLFEKITGKQKHVLHDSRNNVNLQSQVRGNEGCLMISRTTPGEVNPDLWADDINTAITIALDLKRRWLLSEYNKERIDSGKIISDIAVGIHFGQAWINKVGDNEYRPEGYAINLTKKIESHSQEGVYTHIYISAAAYNRLSPLTDEWTYSFDVPRLINLKGNSQGINVFEVKHHFLPTNLTAEKTKASQCRTYEPSADDIEKLKIAHLANPTNLWLLEECIMMQIHNGCKELLEQGKEEDVRSLENAYRESASIARKFATSSTRDAVSLVSCLASYWGNIEITKKSNGFMNKK
jgi:class 3 adenylate cyclase